MNKNTKNQKGSSAASNVIGLADVSLENSQIKGSVVVGFSQWVRALLQNWRQGTVACKGRSDVNRTGKKPWKQKGTGRARAGSSRSPLWRGGGVSFGPQPRVRSLRVPQHVKSNVLQVLMADHIKNGNVMSLNWQLTHDAPKTSQAYTALKELGVHENKVLMLLSPIDSAAYASFVNIPNVRIVYFDQVNAFDMAQNDSIVFLQKDTDQFKEMVAQWI